MSLNVSESLVPSGSPLPFSEISIQAVALFAVTVVVGVAVLVLFYYKYYSNMSNKVVMTVFETPDGRVNLRYYFHEIGARSVSQSFDDVEELEKFLAKVLGGLFG